MKLVTVSIVLEDKLEIQQPKLEAGEFVITRVIPLSELGDYLRGNSAFSLGFDKTTHNGYQPNYAQIMLRE